MLKVWAIANQKGGVGKTTTTVSLAGILAKLGRPTLLMDLDPHGSLSSYFGYDPDHAKNSIYQLFQDKAPEPQDILVETGIDHLALLPASTAMATLDRQLGSQMGKGLVIANAVKALVNDFEFVLIDCPPILGVLMVNAMAACEHLIIPVQTDYLAIKGLERIINTLKMIARASKRQLPYTIVPTMFDKRTRVSHDSLRILREDYPYHLWEGVIPVDTMFRDACLTKKPLTILKPNARGAIAYRHLLNRQLNIVTKPETELMA